MLILKMEQKKLMTHFEGLAYNNLWRSNPEDSWPINYTDEFIHCSNVDSNAHESYYSLKQRNLYSLLVQLLLFEQAYAIECTGHLT